MVHSIRRFFLMAIYSMQFQLEDLRIFIPGPLQSQFILKQLFLFIYTFPFPSKNHVLTVSGNFCHMDLGMRFWA
ncbi:hypothetical protein I7I48_05311 [Histoplasma ohiense]|nr:hypothetical protein I7I48_05311 [Histoplasma ohiense (nom. inval.)]